MNRDRRCLAIIHHIVDDEAARDQRRWSESLAHGIDSLYETNANRLQNFIRSESEPQFTAAGWIDAVETANAKVSVNGKGRFTDTLFVERLWRSLKYEEVYLYAYDSMAAAKAGIAGWFCFYNDERLHQALGYRPPAAILRAARLPVDMPLRLDNADALPTYPQA